MVAGIESYDAVKNELKFFATSSVRVKLLISLNEEEMSVDHLRSEFGYRTSTILPVIAELKSKDLIYQDNRCYGVTPLGKLVSLKLIDFIRGTFTDYNQIPNFKIRFHTITADDHISNLATHLAGSKYCTCESCNPVVTNKLGYS